MTVGGTVVELRGPDPEALARLVNGAKTAEPGFAQQRPPSGQQPPVDGAGPQSRESPLPPRRRRKALLFGGIGLVVALVAGLTMWLAWPTHLRNREPFEQAMASLAAARGVRYTDTLSAGLGKRDITTTEYGEQFGTSDWEGDESEVLTVNDTFYNKRIPKTGQTRPNQPDEDKWRTGDDLDSVHDEPRSQYLSPPDLADRLGTALEELSELPSPEDPDLPPLTVEGVEALRAVTSVGSIFVAKHAPYRVLRVDPYGLLHLPPSEVLSLPSIPSRPDPLVSNSEGIDITPIVGALADQMYDTLADKTKQLADAVDGSFRFDVDNKDGDVNCELGGCTANESFTGTLDTRSSSARIAGGQVTTTMSVAFTINGHSAGACTSPPGTFPVTGNTVRGQMSCSAPEGGAIMAELKAQAEAQSRASGRPVSYRWVAWSLAHVTALASARTEVNQLLDQQKEERNSPPCQTPNSFAPGTPVLLADGNTRPIEQITPGDQVRATDPITGRTTAKPVLAHITGTGQKQLDQLAITDGQHTATVTATAGHPFWDPAQWAWITAGDLRPGTALASLSGSGPVHVTGNRAYQAPLTVHNLTVDGIHTYYVLAGKIPVLVHNANGDCHILGVGDFPKKVVNSNMGHINEERAARAGFDSVQSVQAAVRDLGKSIERNGFPKGTISDTAHTDRVLVPIGEKGYAVYQIKSNENAVFKTILERRS